MDSVIADSDLVMEPDFATLCTVPWRRIPRPRSSMTPTIATGARWRNLPGRCLKNVLGLYAKHGWTPVVAPEIEFYLVEPNTDPDYPLKPPVGRSGRRNRPPILFDPGGERVRRAVRGHLRLFRAQGLEIDTLIHEDGAAQMEINLRHGDPLMLADQVFLFKRTIREAALGIRSTPPSWPSPSPTSRAAPCISTSRWSTPRTGKNIFSDADGDPTPEFFSFIAGQQKYLPAVLSILAPYVNSYRRLTPDSMAPINVQWAMTTAPPACACPPPTRSPRVENRVPSSDANPYLAIAASLACGYLGIEGPAPTDPLEGDARTSRSTCPRGLLEAVDELVGCEELAEVLGRRFYPHLCGGEARRVRDLHGVISPWEREYLLLNV